MNVSSKKPVTRTRARQRPIGGKCYARKTNAQDESRVVKKSKARGGSSNQSLLKRKTIPLHPHGRSMGRRESYAIVRWRTGVFWKCVTKKTVGEAESAMTQSSAGNNRRERGAKKLDRYRGGEFVGHKGEVGLSLVGVLSVGRQWKSRESSCFR